MLARERTAPREYGLSVLLASHVLAAVERSGDRIGGVGGGRVVHAGEVGQFTRETEAVFIEVDTNRDRLVAALERRGVRVAADGGGLVIEGPDETVYDQVRDALVEAEAPLRRMAPRRHVLTELFEREDAA
jgi:ABC-2 type transport system ATP-binding protein